MHFQSQARALSPQAVSTAEHSWHCHDSCLQDCFCWRRRVRFCFLLTHGLFICVGLGMRSMLPHILYFFLKLKVQSRGWNVETTLNIDRWKSNFKVNTSSPYSSRRQGLAVYMCSVPVQCPDLMLSPLIAHKFGVDWVSGRCCLEASFRSSLSATSNIKVECATCNASEHMIILKIWGRLVESTF